MPTENPKLTITLTGRRPVTITKAAWPVIAAASEKEYDGQFDFQSNKTAKFDLLVRQHEDGRAIVYGVYHYDTNYQNSRDYDIRGGELLEKDGDIPAAILRVAADLEARIPEHIEGAYGRGTFPRIAHVCVADLPAVELDESSEVEAEG